MVTTYFLNCIIGNVFGTKTTPSIPSGYYLGVSTTTPAIGGGNVSEPTGNNYARVQIPASKLSAPAAGVISNTEMIELNEATGNWGTVTHFVIYNAASGGNLLMYDQLDTPRDVQSATQLRFKPNALKITLKNPA